MHIEKPTNMKVRSKSLASTADLYSMDMRSAFSRPQANNMPPTNELSVLPNAGLRDNGLLSSLCPHNESNRLYRQDIPVAQESLLRDVGLTVYTETPGGPGEPMQRSLSVPSPLSHKELSQSVQPSWESRTALKNGGSPEHNSNKELQAEVDTQRKAKSDSGPPFRGEVNLRICRSRSESSRSPQKEASPRITRLSREVSFVFEDSDGNGRYAISEPLTYKNESTIADKHLENLLIQEKANALPAEDLSNLYEVKCAKGIPENESIEQRAARILGIAVPVEALGVADNQLSEDNQDEADATVAEKRLSPSEETQQVIGECEQVNEESHVVHGTETEAMETRLGVDQEEGNRQKHSSYHSDGEHILDAETQSAVVLDLPEFPPSKLLLSLPVTPDEKLALSMCSGEKKGRGGACKLIESLQDKLNSSASSCAMSPGRSTTDRMARLKELDSVSRIRRLSLKGSESGGEAGAEERNGDREEGEVEEEAKEEVEGKLDEEEEKRQEEEGREEEENPDEHENAHETHEKLGDPEEDCKPEEVNEVICEEEQRQDEEEGEIHVEIALKVDNEGSEEVDVELKTEEPEGEVELKIVEDDKEKPVEELRDGQNAEEVSRAESTQDAEGEKLPKPKQRTRLQKPPLLPKPRSVPKREITLPLSFSSGTCGPSNMEDEEVLSVSDAYDPSRVERV
ncbi:uncharacterized protein LOC111228240 [Seriola dumerili]|nr:uncharacterized protein LOC111228240 [Seriola dumerili]